MDGTAHRQRQESWATRLISGGIRKTRLHDELGQPVSLARALRNGPRAVGTGILRLLFGYRPNLPWISYDAQTIASLRIRRPTSPWRPTNSTI